MGARMLHTRSVGSSVQSRNLPPCVSRLLATDKDLDFRHHHASHGLCGTPPCPFQFRTVLYCPAKSHRPASAAKATSRWFWASSSTRAGHVGYHNELPAFQPKRVRVYDRCCDPRPLLQKLKAEAFEVRRWNWLYSHFR